MSEGGPAGAPRPSQGSLPGGTGTQTPGLGHPARCGCGQACSQGVTWNPRRLHCPHTANGRGRRSPLPEVGSEEPTPLPQGLLWPEGAELHLLPPPTTVKLLLPRRCGQLSPGENRCPKRSMCCRGRPRVAQMAPEHTCTDAGWLGPRLLGAPRPGHQEVKTGSYQSGPRGSHVCTS